MNYKIQKTEVLKRIVVLKVFLIDDVSIILEKDTYNLALGGRCYIVSFAMQTHIISFCRKTISDTFTLFDFSLLVSNVFFLLVNFFLIRDLDWFAIICEL